MPPPPSAPGTFTLSVDLELAWGEFYRRPVDTARLLEARRVFPDLLRLLERHRVAATFAVVGHLLLEGCDGHAEMPRPRIAWRPGDWLAGDPRTDEARDPAWYAPSLVAQVRQAPPGHDVGAHGFSHVPLDDPGVGADVAAAEVAACARLLRAGGHGASSFVFPRNGISYVEVLAEHGFACYRAREERWWSKLPGPVRKAAHMMEQILAVAPPVGRPLRRGAVVAAPSSMLFLSREGFRRRVPMRSRVARARKGLDAAVRTGGVFHLWLHAEDLVPDSAQMLAGLDAVLRDARARADRGALAIRTMAELPGVAAA